MSKTIPIEQLPRQAERLLRVVWEGHETVLLEHNGEPVAAVVPMDDYRRLHLNTEKAKRGRRKVKTLAPPSAPPLAYELPAELLEAYHRFVSKKFSDEGLTPEEEAEFERVGKELGEADLATPLEQAAWQKHKQEMALLDELVAKRKALEKLR